MLKDNEITSELNKVMGNALLQLQQLVANDPSKNHDFLTVVKTFLLGTVSTAVDLVELHAPGSAPHLYADVEAAAKLGGLRAINKWSSDHGSPHYSVSNIADNDMPTAMNYIGQKLTEALFKGLYELPVPLRKIETLLRSLEAMLANLLNEKFQNDAGRILDSFCEHVHMALADLESRKKN